MTEQTHSMLFPIPCAAGIVWPSGPFAMNETTQEMRTVLLPLLSNGDALDEPWFIALGKLNHGRFYAAKMISPLKISVARRAPNGWRWLALQLQADWDHCLAALTNRTQPPDAMVAETHFLSLRFDEFDSFVLRAMAVCAISILAIKDRVTELPPYHLASFGSEVSEFLVAAVSVISDTPADMTNPARRMIQAHPALQHYCFQVIEGVTTAVTFVLGLNEGGIR